MSQCTEWDPNAGHSQIRTKQKKTFNIGSWKTGKLKKKEENRERLVEQIRKNTRNKKTINRRMDTETREQTHENTTYELIKTAGGTQTGERGKRVRNLRNGRT